jgi:hypothetical protein
MPVVCGYFSGVRCIGPRAGTPHPTPGRAVAHLPERTRSREPHRDAVSKADTMDYPADQMGLMSASGVFIGTGPGDSPRPSPSS